MQKTFAWLHCKENPIYVFPEKKLRGLRPNFHIYGYVGDLYILKDRSTYFPAADYADRSWKYINRSQNYEYRNWD
jgi:hypothetical protein